MNLKFLYRKIFIEGRSKKIFLERVTEPIHLNLLSLFWLLFGNYKKKIKYDLIIRSQYAFSLLTAVERAKELGIESVSVIEFGVATGAGLMNMSRIAKKLSKIYKINITVHGFDTGKGMPPAKDFRDHPEYYQEGDFKMDFEPLKKKMDSNCVLHLGELRETIPHFLNTYKDPIGFIAFDVDYYSSTMETFEIFNAPSDLFLPNTLLYFDDIILDNHNIYQGELLAIKDYNNAAENSKIDKFHFLKTKRVLKNAMWIDQIYQFHNFSHKKRKNLYDPKIERHVTNPLL